MNDIQKIQKLLHLPMLDDLEYKINNVSHVLYNKGLSIKIYLLKGDIFESNFTRYIAIKDDWYTVYYHRSYLKDSEGVSIE